MMDDDLNKKAINLAVEAVMLDRKMKFQEAVKKYYQTIEVLLMLIKSNETRNHNIDYNKKIQEYRSRAELLEEKFGLTGFSAGLISSSPDSVLRLFQNPLH